MKHAITTTTHSSKPFIVTRCKGAKLNVPIEGDHALDQHRLALKAMLDYQGGEDNAPLDRWVAGVLPQGGFVWLPVPRHFEDTRPQAYILQTPTDPFHPERGLQKQETYSPAITLARQYAFAIIDEEPPKGEGCGTTTRWRIKAQGGLVLYAYSWPKAEGETCDN